MPAIIVGIHQASIFLKIFKRKLAELEVVFSSNPDCVDPSPIAIYLLAGLTGIIMRKKTGKVRTFISCNGQVLS